MLAEVSFWVDSAHIILFLCVFIGAGFILFGLIPILKHAAKTGNWLSAFLGISLVVAGICVFFGARTVTPLNIKDNPPSHVEVERQEDPKQVTEKDLEKKRAEEVKAKQDQEAKRKEDEDKRMEEERQRLLENLKGN